MSGFDCGSCGLQFPLNAEKATFNDLVAAINRLATGRRSFTEEQLDKLLSEAYAEGRADQLEESKEKT